MNRLVAPLAALFLLLLPLTVLGEPLVPDEAISLYREGSYEEALPLLLKARAAAPDSAEVARYLGMTQRQTGDYAAAIENLKAALTLNPPAREAAPELIAVLINANEDEEALRWIAWSEREAVKPGEIAFLKGLLLRKQGKGEAAVAAFTAAGQTDPALAGAGAFQTALVRIDQRQGEAARRSLETVITGAPDSDLAALAREYAAGLGRLPGRRCPLEFSVGVGYLYDTNVELNRFVQTATPQPGRSDNGVTQQLRIGYTAQTGSPLGFSADYRLFNTSYFKVRDYSQLYQAVRAVPSYRLGATTLALPLSFATTLLDYRGYQHQLEVKPAATVALTPEHLLQVAGGYGWRDMLADIPSPTEDRNADLYSGLAGYLFLFADNRGMFNLRYEFTREETAGANWRNNGHKLDADLLLPLFRGTSLTIAGEGLWQQYDTVHSVFGVKRDDAIYSGTATLTHNLFAGLRLHLQVLLTRALSNIPLYDYSRTVTSTMLEYRY